LQASVDNSVVMAHQCASLCLQLCYATRNINVLVCAYLLYVGPLIEYTSEIRSFYLKPAVQVK